MKRRNGAGERERDKRRWWWEEPGRERWGYFIIQTRIRGRLGLDGPPHVGCEFQMMCCFCLTPNPKYPELPGLAYLSLTHS